MTAPIQDTGPGEQDAVDHGGAVERSPTLFGAPAFARRLARSFRFAGMGVAYMVRSQPNARIHLTATIVAIAASAWFQIDRLEWCLVAFAATAVWVAEALNTVLELFLDAIAPEYNPLIGRAKDVAAGAVLLAAAGAAVVGLLVFLPRLAAWK